MAVSRSTSVWENRQVRTRPSAVSRVRVQSAQKGRVTEAMMPTSPRMVSGSRRSATRNFSAGAPFRGAESGVSTKRRSEEHTSELQSRGHLVCRLLLEKKKNRNKRTDDCSERI